jgi:hypothetical protein
MRQDAEDGGRRLEQGCRAVDAIVLVLTAITDPVSVAATRMLA